MAVSYTHLVDDNVIVMTNINDDKIVEEVVLNSDDNNGNFNSEVGRSDNYDNISENMMLKNIGVNIESTDEVLEYNNGMLMCVYESERKLSLIHIYNIFTNKKLVFRVSSYIFIIS